MSAKDEARPNFGGYIGTPNHSKHRCSPHQRATLTAKQKGRCAICGATSKKLVVDHCHKLGSIRGLLCSSCNLGLGCFRDSKAHLRKAIRYLEPFSVAAIEREVREIPHPECRQISGGMIAGVKVSEIWADFVIARMSVEWIADRVGLSVAEVELAIRSKIRSSKSCA